MKTELAKAQEKLGSSQGAEESAGNSEAMRSEIDKLQKEVLISYSILWPVNLTLNVVGNGEKSYQRRGEEGFLHAKHS